MMIISWASWHWVDKRFFFFQNSQAQCRCNLEQLSKSLDLFTDVYCWGGVYEHL